MSYPLSLVLLLCATAAVVVLCCCPTSSSAWLWKRKHEQQLKEEEEEEGGESEEAWSRRRRRSGSGGGGGGAVLEYLGRDNIIDGGGITSGSGSSLLMQRAQSMVVGGGGINNINLLDEDYEERPPAEVTKYSCWQRAYKRLVSSCLAILKDEEKKCRLAYQFTDCFLRMSGWPPPPPCPDTVPVRSCTEKVDKHTHELYLAFFVESEALCHRLQSEAFRQETVDVVNDLKETGHWVLDRVKQVERLSHQILSDAVRQSKQVTEKLNAVESLSQSLRAQNEEMGEQVKKTMGGVQAVYEKAGVIAVKQEELKKLNQEMEAAMAARLEELKAAAADAFVQLDGISRGNRELAEQQLVLADSLAANIGRLKDSAMESFYELKETQATAMEETRSSLQGLLAQAQTAQSTFDMWRIEMDGRNRLLLDDLDAMHRAQEAFVSKQSSVLSILDRMFSLYDSILYESRALKLFLFYGTSIVFVHVLTSTKQINSARVPLYGGLFASMGVELYLMKAYGSLLNNQQWIQTSCYWTRVFFGAFTAVVVLYFIVTYRDIAWQNHVLLLELNRKLSSILNQSSTATTCVDDIQLQDPHHVSEAYSSSSEACSPPWKANSRLPSQIASQSRGGVASKIIYRAKLVSSRSPSEIM